MCPSAGRLPNAPAASERAGTGREAPMEATAAVADQAAGLDIPGGSGLARMPIPTPRPTPRELALGKNMIGPIARMEGGRHEPELLLAGERGEVALEQGG